MDKDFKNGYGNRALYAARGVMACVQNVFRWPSSMVKIEFRLTNEITSKSNVWTVDPGNLYDI